MHDTNGDEASAADPLAEIVRAAGRRAEPPQADYDQVYSTAHAVWQRKLRNRQQRRWYAIAAVLGVLAFGGLLWQSLPESTADVTARIAIARGSVETYLPDLDAWTGVPRSVVELQEGTRIRTGDDGAVSLNLLGGGSLRLAEDSDVQLGQSSFELHSGLVYFDSGDRPDASTIDVVTSFGTIRDIGTQFEVRTSVDTLRIRVRSGSIVLLDSLAADPISGNSGQEIRINAAGQLARREIAPDDPAWAWAESLAVAPEFTTPTVLRYLAWIAEEMGKALEFESESVRLQAELARFLGDPSGLMPTELLVTIAATSDFDCEITSHGTILISRDTEQQ